MRTPTMILVLLATLLATPVHNAQTPTAALVGGTLMQLTVDELPADRVATIGITRTTYAAEGSLHLATGSGPAVSFVESGAVTVTVQNGAPLMVGAGTPTAIEPGSEVVVTAGNGFLLPPGAIVDVRNHGTIPATVLDLFSASDAEAKPGEDTTQAVLVRQEASLPEPPVSVTLSRTTLEPGDRLPLAEAPTLTVYATVERGDAFVLTGQGVNRATEPIEAYVLEIGPPATSPET